MVNCCVVGCNNNRKNSSVTLHQFPNKQKESERYKAWENQINRNNFNPNSNHVVCSVHFTEADFENDLMRSLLPGEKIKRLLKNSAVPSLLLLNEPKNTVTPIRKSTYICKKAIIQCQNDLSKPDCPLSQVPHCEKTKEYGGLQAALTNSTIISTSTVKIEMGWDYSETQHFSEDTLMHKWDMLEPVVIRPEGKVVQKNEECILNLSNKISSSYIEGSTESSPKQLEISVKTENNEFISEINIWPQVEDQKIENKEVSPKEEDLVNENNSRDYSSNQLLISVKTDNSATTSEIDKWPEIAYDDWKIKNEEVDVKEEDLLEINSHSMFSGRSSQEKCDDFKKFMWHVCDFKTDKKMNLNRHILNHKKPKKLFRCDECEYVTRYKNALKNHSLRHKNPEEWELFRCHICIHVTRRKDALKEHILRHKTPEEHELFKCDKCEYGTRFKYALKKHIQTHKTSEEIDVFKRDKSEFRSSLRHTLEPQEPEEVHLFGCDKCEFRTRYKKSLKHHVLRHQDPEKIDLFKCNNCEYRTSYRNKIKQHELRHKNSEEVELFRCDKCDHTTRYKAGLKRHFIRHKNLKEVDLFQCSKCTYQSRFKDDLRKHILRHCPIF